MTQALLRVTCVLLLLNHFETIPLPATLTQTARPARLPQGQQPLLLPRGIPAEVPRSFGQRPLGVQGLFPAEGSRFALGTDGRLHFPA